MDILSNLLLWLHLIGLALGGAVAFGMPVVGRQIGLATPETRPVLFKITKGLSTVGRAAIVILIITGPLLIWAKYGGNGNLGVWFNLKMLLVVLLIVSIIVSGLQGKRAENGDSAAAARMPMLGAANLVLLVLIVLCAVFAFN